MNILSSSRAADPVALGAAGVDRRCTFDRGALHDVYADEGDAASALGFSLLVMVRAAIARPVVVVRDDRCVASFGRLYGDGLAGLGIEPASLIVVHAAGTLATLRTAVDATTCAGLGAVVVQPWRGSPVDDLTASRRIALRARNSGVLVVAVRVGVPARPSAAATRWRVRASPSTALAANAPGPPAFDLSLLHHRRGIAGFDARVEWNRDQRCFGDAPLPRPRPAVAAGRARDAGEGGGERRAA